MSGRTSAHHHAADPALRHVLTHLLTPLLMCLGMGLAYMGAFVHPEPHHLPVAVVGEGPRAMVFAQTVKDGATTRSTYARSPVAPMPSTSSRPAASQAPTYRATRPPS